MNRFRILNIYLKIRLSLKALKKLLADTTYLVRSFWYSLIILFILQWSFNISILVAIAQTQPLELPRFMIDGVINLLRYNGSFVAFGMIAIAIMQGISLAAVKFIRNSKLQPKTNVKVSIAVTLFGTGCVACGGSILAPLLANIPATFSVAISRVVGNVAILLGLVLSLYSLVSIGLKASPYINQKGGKK